MQLIHKLAKAIPAAITVVAFVFMFLPIVVVIGVSFTSEEFLAFPPPGYSVRWYEKVSNDPVLLAAIWNSVYIAIPVALLSVVLGVFAALVVARSRVWWSSWLAALVAAPMMIPSIILAIGLYPTMIDARLNGTFVAVVLAHSIIATPLVFIMVRAALQTYSPTLEMAAMTLGASWIVAFRRITLPMIMPSLVTASAFALVTSFDEVILTLFLATPSTTTLPLIIWQQLNYNVSPAIAAVATIIICVSLALVALAAAYRKIVDVRRSKEGNASRIGEMV